MSQFACFFHLLENNAASLQITTYVFDRTAFPTTNLSLLQLIAASESPMFLKLTQWIRSTIFGRAEDRRRHPRLDRQTPLTLQPLDQDLSPIGRPIAAMSRDISQSGIGFTCEQQLDCPYVRVTVNEDKYSAIGRIRHERESEESGAYLFGIEFLDDQDGE